MCPPFGQTRFLYTQTNFDVVVVQRLGVFEIHFDIERLINFKVATFDRESYLGVGGNRSIRGNGGGVNGKSLGVGIKIIIRANFS